MFERWDPAAIAWTFERVGDENLTAAVGALAEWKWWNSMSAAVSVPG